jgi:hypothetical protein
MDINSLLPHHSQTEQKKVAVQLEKKWARTGLLEGLNSEVERSSMAVILENQAKQLVTEANATGTGANDEQWAGVALPLVRRIFAEIAAKDFVSVQPMNLPSGLVFFLDFKYGTSQGTNGFGNATGNDFATGAGRTSQTDSVFGITDADRGAATATEGLYGAGRFGYTINDVNADITAVATGSWSTSNTFDAQTTPSALSGVGFNIFTNFNTEFSASAVANNRVYQVVQVTAADLTRPDLNGVRAFNLSGSGIVTIVPEFTRENGTNVYFLAQVASTPAIGVGTCEVAYHQQPIDSNRGDFEDISPVVGGTNNSGTALDIPEINLEMRSEAIVAKTRKLKAIWSPEFAQDLNAYHSIDAEAELTSMLSEYISQEIDLEILDMLIQNGQTVERWSAKVGFEFDASTNTFGQGNATAQAYNQGTWFQTLGTKIQKVSNKIHQLTLRGGANFLVCSPTVATILESIPGYAADTDGNKMQFAMGVQKVGAINNRFQVYKNPYMTENTILMGYRGSQFLETGAVYAPYIPLIMTPLVYDPDNFTPRKGVMTRYAKKMLRPEFYGKVFVHGLDTI